MTEMVVMVCVLMDDGASDMKKPLASRGSSDGAGVRYRWSHAPVHHPPCMAEGRHGQPQDMAMVVNVAGLWHDVLSQGKTSTVASR